jgi:hypothetical protein
MSEATGPVLVPPGSESGTYYIVIGNVRQHTLEFQAQSFPDEERIVTLRDEMAATERLDEDRLRRRPCPDL